jgi:hypothetical protein
MARSAGMIGTLSEPVPKPKLINRETAHAREWKTSRRMVVRAAIVRAASALNAGFTGRVFG